MSSNANSNLLYGARFFACDLHVHTPCDREWLGQKPGTGDAAKQKYAERFVEACINHGLEVIALVDHNFVRSLEESLEPLIKEEANQHGLIVFPGVELTSSEGIHVVLLLDTCEDFNAVERLVASVFGANDRFDSNGSPLPAPLNLEQLLEKGHEFSAFFYFPHANKTNGLFQLEAGRATAKRIYEEKTPILGIDLGDHPLELNAQVLVKSAIPGAVAGFRHSNWKREGSCRFPPALLWNSDGRALPDEDLPEGNNGRRRIGERFTWIKMSEPSVFALKCAVLDPESRLRYPKAGETPRNMRPLPQHSYLASVRIEGVDFFQQPLEVRFSPHLNCIIGGRGSGKSNLLSLLRYVLRQDDDQSFGKADRARNRYQELLYGNSGEWKLLSGKDARVSAYFVSAGARYEVQRGLAVESQAVGADGQRLEGGGVTTLCRARVFGQGQIEEITRQPALQLKMLDDLLRTELQALQIEENQVRNELIGLQADRLKLVGVDSRLQEARAQREIVRNKLKQLEGGVDTTVRQEYAQWQAEARYFEQVKKGLEQELARLRQIVRHAALVETSLPQPLQQSPRNAVLRAFEGAVNRLCESLRQKWIEAVDHFAEGVKQLSPGDTWEQGFAECQRKWHEEEAKWSRAGVRPEDREALQKEENKWQEQVELLEKDRSKLADVERRIREAQNRLVACWRKAWELRRDKAETLQEAVGNRLTIQVKFAADTDALIDQLTRWFQGSGLREDPTRTLAQKLQPDEANPQDWPMSRFVAALRDGADCLTSPGQDKLPAAHPLRKDFGLSESMALRLAKWVKPELLDEIERHRAPDFVSIAIRDQFNARPVPLENASFGQQCAAVLSLLLAEGDEPVLIDQPEDNLDNEAIHNWVVQEVLRVQKFRRQFIIVTHNANVVVNGDAEMIIALERGVDNEGRVNGHFRKARDAGGQLATVTDSYDRVQTRNAVAEVLEGGDRAFELRGLKYGMEVPRV
jgi:ABC-type lipoprotein export system ATPase subunit